VVCCPDGRLLVKRSAVAFDGSSDVRRVGEQRSIVREQSMASGA
jgi:hypothetical protein